MGFKSHYQVSKTLTGDELPERIILFRGGGGGAERSEAKAEAAENTPPLLIYSYSYFQRKVFAEQ